MALHRIVGLGNPLLDVSAVVPAAFLQKYALRLSNAILAQDLHANLCADMMDNFQCNFLAGGATQNSIRVAQWLSRVPGTSAYFGCVGTDKYASLLREALAKDQVTAYYQAHSTLPTGTCACLVHKSERSLVASLGAALHFDVAHLRKHFHVVEGAELIYSSGFFFTSSPESALMCAEYAGRAQKTYGINLAAEFIIEQCSETIAAVLPFTELVFCNEAEMAKYGAVQGLQGMSVEAVAQHVANSPGVKTRKVIVTRSSRPTIVATTKGEIERFPVPQVDPKLIVDTNGVGDAFVGGFISEYVKRSPLQRCISAGHYAAREVLQREGCSFPPSPLFS